MDDRLKVGLQGCGADTHMQKTMQHVSIHLLWSFFLDLPCPSSEEPASNKSGWDVPEWEMTSSPAAGQRETARGAKLQLQTRQGSRVHVHLAGILNMLLNTPNQVSWRGSDLDNKITQKLESLVSELWDRFPAFTHVFIFRLWEFDDLTTRSNPQILLFLIPIMHISIKYYLFLIELGHFGVMKRSCDPSLWKNVFDWADFLLTPPKQLITPDLPQLSSSPLNLIAIINTTWCTFFVLLSSLAAAVCSLISVFIVSRRNLSSFPTGGPSINKQEE